MATATNIHDELANAASESVPLNGRGFISPEPPANEPTNIAIVLPSVPSTTFGSQSLGQHEVGTPISPTVLNNTFCGIMPQAARDKQHADHVGAASTSAPALTGMPLREDGSVPTPLPTTASQVTKELGPHTGPQQIPTIYPTDMENSGAHLADAPQLGVRGDPINAIVCSMTCRRAVGPRPTAAFR